MKFNEIVRRMDSLEKRVADLEKKLEKQSAKIDDLLEKEVKKDKKSK